MFSSFPISDDNTSGGTSVPVVSFTFRLSFIADFFAITANAATEANYRASVVNLVCQFYLFIFWSKDLIC